MGSSSVHMSSGVVVRGVVAQQVRGSAQQLLLVVAQDTKATAPSAGDPAYRGRRAVALA
jgi:hypothetical protein